MDGLSAGVDLGGTKIQAVVLRGADVAGTARVATPQTGVEGVVEAIASTVLAALEEAGATPSALVGVGIGTPGLVDPATGSVSHAANVPGFSGRVALGPAVAERLAGARVKVENDVTAATLAEWRLGAGRDMQHLVGVFVGTGVGGGLVLGGALHHGRGTAGEIGHMIVQPEGRACGCGRRGCLEAYAGRNAMEAEARRRVANGEDTALFRIMEERGRQRLTSGVFGRALSAGDSMAAGLVADAAWALGLAMASVHNLLDVEAFVVGGGLADRLGTAFLGAVQDQMRPHLFAPAQPPAVLPSALGDLAGAIGAAVAALG